VLEGTTNDDGIDDGTECSRTNRAISLFGAPNYKPTLKTNPVTKAYTTVKGISVSGLREYGKRGIYHATTFRAQDNISSREGDGSGGYFGVQWINGKRDQLLFSVWDRKQNKDRFALPLHSNCKRNCNDCGGTINGKKKSTGTQCKFQLPKRLEENDELKLTIEREEVQSVEYEGTTHSGQQLENIMYNGHVWKVSVEYVSGPNKETFMTDQFKLGEDDVFTLGRILFTENDLEVGQESSGGIVRFNMFHEPIGCTPCDAFNFEVERSGPYIQQAIDSSNIPKIEEGFTGIGYNNHLQQLSSCKDFDIKSCEFGKIIFQTGPGYTPTRSKKRVEKEKLYWTEEGQKLARDESNCANE
jgi:hypothetical protein